MAQWFGLRFEFRALLKPFYCDGYTLQASFDTLIESSESFGSVVGLTLGITRCSEIAQLLTEWSGKNTLRLKRYLSALANEYTGRIVGSSSVSNIPASYFDIELLCRFGIFRHSL